MLSASGSRVSAFRSQRSGIARFKIAVESQRSEKVLLAPGAARPGPRIEALTPLEAFRLAPGLNQVRREAPAGFSGRSVAALAPRGPPRRGNDQN